ncbi:MAG: hypothetical protein RLZZ293_835 [Pseudomonadota bacterium]|jgi:hypothetical protein
MLLFAKSFIFSIYLTYALPPEKIGFINFKGEIK